MNECSDSRSGLLLAGYELGILPEEDLARFEQHLMTCDYCFDQVREFAAPARALREGAAVQESVCRLVAEPSSGPAPAFAAARSRKALPGPSWLSRLRRWAWPESPSAVRPGLGWLLVLLLLVPAYLGVDGLLHRDFRVRPLQSIHLAPQRTINHNVFSTGSGLDGVIDFVVPEAAEGGAFDVRIIADDDAEMMRFDGYDGFDELGTGRLLVPLATMKPGVYHLIVRKAGDRTDPPLHDYRFRIR